MFDMKKCIATLLLFGFCMFAHAQGEPAPRFRMFDFPSKMSMMRQFGNVVSAYARVAFGTLPCNNFEGLIKNREKEQLQLKKEKEGLGRMFNSKLFPYTRIDQ